MSLPILLALSLTAAAPAGDCCSSAQLASATRADTIVETAVANGSFKTLAAALEAGELVDALGGEGPFTVFAPTDAAFEKLPEGTLARLLKPENKGLLRAILTYHVVSGRLPASRVVERPYATTLNGQRIDFEVTDEGVRVDDARVAKTDIECSNGIIHVIDSVILPSTEDIVQVAAAAGDFDTLAKALGAAGLVEALRGEGPFTVFAPTDDAFAALPEGTLASLLEPANKSKLADILKFHVVSGRVYADAAAKGARVKTLLGREITTEARDGSVFVNGARVVKADIETKNGVIHVIDSVLLPN